MAPLHTTVTSKLFIIPDKFASLITEISSLDADSKECSRGYCSTANVLVVYELPVACHSDSHPKGASLSWMQWSPLLLIATKVQG